MKIFRPQYFTVILILCLALQGIQAQHKIDELPVSEKFELAKERAKEYGSLYWYTFSLLKPQILDSMNQLKEEIRSLNGSLSRHKSRVDSIASLKGQTQQKLDKALSEKESLDFLGIGMKKTSYNFILWGIVALLAAFLVLMIVLYKQSHLVTRSTKNDMNDLKMEFEGFRKRALEREESIVRKYHNELNKYKTKAGNLSK
ncbi:MAG: hypothetical protein JW801_02895 [Bacteroidales bacterium]|nr:hypothetical protein [Bacteroidales bacterium]